MTSNGESSKTPSDEAKAKFREALDRKKSVQHHTQESEAGSAGTVRGSETVGPVQRQFRRKSG